MAATGQEGDDIDHYEVLCLPSGEEGAALTIEHIEKAYRTQSRLRHPDKRPDDPNATADFQLLSSSYKLLRDESLRRQFDARLRGRREAAARAAATGVKRRKAVSDLEERERAAAAGHPADPEELAKREAQRMAADIERELAAFRAAKQASAFGATSTSVRVWNVLARIFHALENWLMSSLNELARMHSVLSCSSLYLFFLHLVRLEITISDLGIRIFP
jgi:DnaJ homolog subfamily C member 17